jgi:hypothetical protein
MKFNPAKNSNPSSTPKFKVRWAHAWNQILAGNSRHPLLGIVLVSLLAVIINCYPIIFCGRSYVSPTCVDGKIIYKDAPVALPGMKVDSASIVAQHGSDTGAMMWWGIPVGFIESRSLLEQGALPLWNRYSHAGDTLIGQAVSMLGDPLQLIVILGHGSAGAWDFKYLVAKFLFCVGFGWLIFWLSGNRVLALIYSALAAYCGAWFYINNHPSFFVFAYAPWILLAAIKWLGAPTGRQICWGLIWLLANFACFNAGHVELAVDLIGGLNLAAVAYALISYRQSTSPARILGRMALGTLLFLGLTAPVWMSFLASLEGSFSLHAMVNVVQQSPMALPGAFDDLFYLLLRRNDLVYAVAPGTSLLVLVGCSFSVWRWRQLKGEPFFWVNTGAIVLWGGCVFGWVPSFLLAAIPLLNRVGHISTDFSYLLVMHLIIQSAYGFKCLAKVENLRQAVGDFACAGGALTGIILWYFFGNAHLSMPWNYFLCAGAGAIGAPLLFVFLKSRRQQNLALGWVGIIILGFIPNFRFGLYHRGNDALLMLPGPRVTLNAPSRAVDKIKSDRSGPFRIVSLHGSFTGDYSAVYELENIFSCAPLSNGKLLNLFQSFPGLKLFGDWFIDVADLVPAQPLLNLLNVKYLLAPPNGSIQAPPGFRLTDQSDFVVWENLEVWPRAFFANQIVSLPSNEKFIHHLLENGQQPFVALTGEEIGKHPNLQLLETTNQAIISPATNYRLLPNSTEFDIHAPSAGVVCLTEGQAKNFTARANTDSKEVLTVNRVFKGIYLDQPGDYHIKFIYRPRYWRLSCTCFLGAVGVIIMLASLSLISGKGCDPTVRAAP